MLVESERDTFGTRRFRLGGESDPLAPTTPEAEKPAGEEEAPKPNPKGSPKARTSPKTSPKPAPKPADPGTAAKALTKMTKAATPMPPVPKS